MAHYGVPYMGSKNAIAKMLVEQLPPAQTFVDLFAGGCAVTHAAMVSRKYKRFLANDIDFRGITLFRDAIAGKYRDEKRVITREVYNELKDTDPYVALCWSFGNNPKKNYLWGKDIEGFKLEAFRMLMADTPVERYVHFRAMVRMLVAFKGTLPEGVTEVETVPRMERVKDLECLHRVQGLERLADVQTLERLHRVQGLEIRVGSYDTVEIPDDAVVYCDPPYRGTQKYDSAAFDHDGFIEWLRTRDFPVYVSEYSMPDDFKRIWMKRKNVLMCATDNGKHAEEGLFVHRKWVGKIPTNDLFGYD